jgi:hypothetical protein
MPVAIIYVYEEFEKIEQLKTGVLKAIEKVGIPPKYATVIIQKVPKSQWGKGT